jgi:PPK2 family polyphosphate:nucleotide phosphotransferase
MFKAVKSPCLVPFNGTFRVKNAATSPKPVAGSNQQFKKQLNDLIEQLDEQQRILYAHDRHAILLIFQGMDTAGKDGTIRAVMRGIDPAGCQVISFKQPSLEELDHDFLWRTTRRLPGRGSIGIFNRSYYEEVLIVKVHPELLNNQKLPAGMDTKNIWNHRYKSINAFEKHLARNGTVILKFWLNISHQEQLIRFLSRLEEPHKHWKFSETDVKERAHWESYMDAFELALNATSKPWAPWYAIPADNKDYMRFCVADIIVKSLRSLDLNYPRVSAADKKRFVRMRRILRQEKD